MYVYPLTGTLERLKRNGGIRDYLIGKYRQHTEDFRVRSVGLSFLFGEPRTLVSPDLQKSFLSTGLVHLLVISGLHIGIIAGIFLKTLPRSVSPYMSLIGISLYTFFIVPHEPPVLRATLMFTLFLLSAITYRKPVPVAVLLFSGSIILVIYPHFAFTYSFWMSFFATLYILLYIQNNKGGWFSKSIGVSLSAFAGVSALIANVSYISPLSVAFTPLISPLVIAYSTLGMLSLLTTMTFSPFIDLFNFVGGLFIGAVSVLEAVSFKVYPSIGFIEAIVLTIAGAMLMYYLPYQKRIVVPTGLIFYLIIRSF